MSTPNHDPTPTPTEAAWEIAKGRGDVAAAIGTAVAQLEAAAQALEQLRTLGDQEYLLGMDGLDTLRWIDDARRSAQAGLRIAQTIAGTEVSVPPPRAKHTARHTHRRRAISPRPHEAALIRPALVVTRHEQSSRARTRNRMTTPPEDFPPMELVDVDQQRSPRFSAEIELTPLFQRNPDQVWAEYFRRECENSPAIDWLGADFARCTEDQVATARAALREAAAAADQLFIVHLKRLDPDRASDIVIAEQISRASAEDGPFMLRPGPPNPAHVY